MSAALISKISGWNGTEIKMGSFVRIHATGFGQSAIGEVCFIHQDGTCDLMLLRVNKNPAGWKQSDRTAIHAGKLEAVL